MSIFTLIGLSVSPVGTGHCSSLDAALCQTVQRLKPRPKMRPEEIKLSSYSQERKY